MTTDAAELLDNLPQQDHFLESMADACKAVIAYKGAGEHAVHQRGQPA